DPRVRLVESAPTTAFPSPFLLELPPDRGLTPDAVRRLVDLADRDQLGLVRAGGVQLWRTAAVSRAQWHAADGGSLADRVARLYGARVVSPQAAGVLDLSHMTDSELARGVGAAAGGAFRPGRWLPATVEVAGVRSLGQAGVVVARMVVRQAGTRLRRLLGR